MSRGVVLLTLTDAIHTTKLMFFIIRSFTVDAIEEAFQATRPAEIHDGHYRRLMLLIILDRTNIFNSLGGLIFLRRLKM